MSNASHLLGTRVLRSSVPQGASPQPTSSPLISTVTKTILYLVYNANKTEGERGALFDLNVDWILQTEKVVGRKGAGAGGRHIDWVCIRRNKKWEVVVGVVVCERWEQMGAWLLDIAA